MDSPRVRERPRGVVASDDADDAIFFSQSYGLTPDDWQEGLLEDWLARNRKGKWAASTCWLCVARQNGKNGAIEMRELYGMVLLGEKILHTAHEVKTARKAFRRLKHFFGSKPDDESARYPELNALVAEVRSTNGQEAIILKDTWYYDGGLVRSIGSPGAGAEFVAEGGSIEFVARSRGSGRGYTVDVLIIDEAQELTDEELEALKPTISAAPLRNPQTIYVGTPPSPDRKNLAAGEVFTRIRNNVDAGKAKRTTLTDFGVPDGPLPDITDWGLIRACNPGLVAGRLQKDVIEDELENLSPEGFARERMGWWGDPKAATGTAFGEGSWEACYDQDLEGWQPETWHAIGLAGDFERTRASIAGVYAEGEDVLPGVQDQRDGTGWIVPEAARIQDEHGCPVAIDEKGPLADLIPALEAAGVELTKLDTPKVLDATAGIYDRVRERRLRHVNQPELNAAVRAANKRNVGDRWMFGRRQSTSDISMLEAATLATWVIDQGLNYDVEDSYLSPGG